MLVSSSRITSCCRADGAFVQANELGAPGDGAPDGDAALLGEVLGPGEAAADPEAPEATGPGEPFPALGTPGVTSPNESFGLGDVTVGVPPHPATTNAKTAESVRERSPGLRIVARLTHERMETSDHGPVATR